MKKLLVVVPAYNEGQSIKSVIKDLVKHGFRNILVVDDGSGDKTGDIAFACKAVVVRHIVNRGLGAALGTGFTYGLKNNYDFLVTFDADGQHKASDITKLQTHLLMNNFDVVIGSRIMAREKMPKKRRVLNVLSNMLTFSISNVWVSDSLSGLRIFNRKAMEKISIKTDRMEVSNEIIREVGRNKLRIGEVPIKAIYTQYSVQNSKQGRFASLRIVIKLILSMFR